MVTQKTPPGPSPSDEPSAVGCGSGRAQAITGGAQSGRAPLLARLAGLYRIQTGYRDAQGCERRASAESLLKILQALGAQVEAGPGSDRALVCALAAREKEIWETMADPVLVAWEGVLPAVTLRLPASVTRSAGARVELDLMLEDGSGTMGVVPLTGSSLTGAVEADGRAFMAVSLPGAQVRRALGIGTVSPGWHRLRARVGAFSADILVISAPRRCWEPARNEAEGHRPGLSSLCDPAPAFEAPLRSLAGRDWGVFAPLYALRSGRDWGAGDLADLERLMEWTKDQGGSLVATLPLLATAQDLDGDPSPYRPLSRLFWNEFFLAPEKSEEWELCEPARRLASSAATMATRDSLRSGDLVDYAAVMALKRPVLEELADCFFATAGSARWRQYEDYLRGRPLAADYAAFRAALNGPRGAARAPDRYHLYCQWQMERQLATLTGPARPGLLFDLPLGVHPEGFDVARRPELFAAGVSAGAPPDAFFAGGQDWVTPPLHPEADRRDGYRYFAACLDTLMRHASALRIDHMMSFHRLYWIPEGMEPKDGAYLTYPAEELYAVLCLGSHRHQTTVVGEDLGTVPRGVRASMGRHGVARTSVFLGSLGPRAKTLAAKVPPGSLATLETHDMVPLAGFLEGDDIAMRVKTGQVDRVGARREAAGRRHLVSRLARLSGAPQGEPVETARAILVWCLESLARSPARTVLVNLEDLLLERRPQNVPGTGKDWPNWRRKMAVRLEDLKCSRADTPTQRK
jgi:4-alpha-glucanotransferase